MVQAKIKEGSRKRKLTDDGYDEESLADLDEWRQDPSNWVESESPPVKRQYREEDEIKTHEDDEKFAFFNSRVEDFKLFLKRRLPPDNESAQSYYETFFRTSNAEFANELKTKLNGLSLLGGIDMIFTLMCNKVNMKATEFVDRSIDDRASWPEKKKQEQLQFEILDFHTQLRNLVKLAKELPDSYFAVQE